MVRQIDRKIYLKIVLLGWVAMLLNVRGFQVNNDISIYL